MFERGLDFADADQVFRGHHFTLEDVREDYSEQRYLTVGKLAGRMVVMVWTPRGEARRMISMRKANEREKHAMKTDWVDPDDAPELTDEFFDQADEYQGDKLVRVGRPRTTSPKQALTVRYDPEVIDAFKATGKGWQTRMNAALKDWLKTHSPA